MSDGRLPDFFIAGHAKCGTTAIYEMLRRHPHIFMPELKEPYFFATELSDRSATPRSGALPATFEEYTALFADARPTQLAGEASAFYLWSKDAARRIASVSPDARVVGVFREPASFLRSLHLQFVQDHHEDQRDLRRALDLEPARRDGRNTPRSARWPALLRYSEHVKYAEQLKRFHEHLPPEQFLPLIYDDLRRDNAGTIRRILAFLGVPEHTVEPLEANPTVGLRSQRLDNLIHSVSVGRGAGPRVVKQAIKLVVPRRARRRALEEAQRRVVFAKPPPEDDRLMRELRVRFKPEVTALGEYLGRDLITLWGYDRLS